MNGNPMSSEVKNMFITVGDKRYLRGCGIATRPHTSIGEKGAVDLVELGLFAGDDPVTGALFAFMFPRHAVTQMIEALNELQWTDIEEGTDGEVDDAG